MLDCHVGLVIKNVQINPAAKNPLYNPWFAANALVGANKSLGNGLKISGPLVS